MIPFPTTFATSAQKLTERGWRPFPGYQKTKKPAMELWNKLNHYSWDSEDLNACITDYLPQENFCCCLAVQSEIVALDLDILDNTNANYANKLADEILGITPLLRIGLAPKSLRVYRNGSHVRSSKPHPVEIFAGTGQFVGFGWHQEAGRAYQWPKASPLDLNADSLEIPLLFPDALDQFLYELFKETLINS